MTESISAEELQRLIVGYVLYELSPEEAVALEQLMVTNPAIAQEIEQTQKALELAYSSPEVQPPKRLRAAVLQVAAPPDNLNDAPVPLAPSSLSERYRRWVVGLGAVAAMLIAGLGISNVILWRSLQALRTQTLTADLLAVSLEPIEPNSLASATVLIDSDNLEATLRVENLPPLPEGQVYVLWTVLQPDAPFTTDDKDAILTEVFTVGEQDELAQIPLPPVYRERQWVSAIAVTVEEADAPQRHESSPVLIERL